MAEEMPRKTRASIPDAALYRFRMPMDEVISTRSKMGTVLVFEKQSGSSFIVSVLPGQGRKGNAISVFSNGKDQDPSCRCKCHVTEKEAAAALRSWGGGSRNAAELARFLSESLTLFDAVSLATGRASAKAKPRKPGKRHLKSLKRK